MHSVLILCLYLSMSNKQKQEIMKAIIKTQIGNATERVNAYVAKLKHGSTFKYVKGLTKEQRTLANICLFRQNNGEVLELTNSDMAVFGMTTSSGKGMAFIVDVTVFGKLTIVPLYSL